MMLHHTRRHFFQQSAASVGAAALAQLIGDSATNAANATPARAKRVIYLFQSGAPSQVDLFDYQPELKKLEPVHGILS